jgi:hypothetical protein
MNARPALDHNAYRAAKIERCIADATAAFEAGFLSEAARKRAQQDVSRAYEAIRDLAHHAQIDYANATPGLDVAPGRGEFFAANEMPFDLHQVRDRHLPIFERFGGRAEVVRSLIDLRAAIKAAPVAPAPARPEVEIKAERVRLSIVEEMKRRNVAFVERLDAARFFNELYPRRDGGIALPVSVNAHWVHGHKGAVFLRHFFYLRGVLTPLNTIIAIAETLEREAGR